MTICALSEIYKRTNWHSYSHIWLIKIDCLAVFVSEDGKSLLEHCQSSAQCAWTETNWRRPWTTIQQKAMATPLNSTWGPDVVSICLTTISVQTVDKFWAACNPKCRTSTSYILLTMSCLSNQTDPSASQHLELLFVVEQGGPFNRLYLAEKKSESGYRASLSAVSCNNTTHLNWQQSDMPMRTAWCPWISDSDVCVTELQSDNKHKRGIALGPGLPLHSIPQHYTSPHKTVHLLQLSLCLYTALCCDQHHDSQASN